MINLKCLFYKIESVLIFYKIDLSYVKCIYII